MKLEVLNAFISFVLKVLSRIIEVSFRVLLFILPLGVFLLIAQFRGKGAKVSNLSVFTTENSIWQHVFPGFILIAIDPDRFKSEIRRCNKSFQEWVERNKYTLAFLFMLTIVVLMYVKG